MWVEHISRHDCFFRYMYSYSHVAILDTDEVVMPADSKLANIGQLLKKAEQLEGFQPDSVSFRMLYMKRLTSDIRARYISP